MSARRDTAGRGGNAVDKRRVILDAAIRVFAREGFHRCRVSDIANEANVAYGLVYHYFRSKDEVLDTLFTERWTLLLEAIAEVDRGELPIRDKLSAVASFIIDSYQHDPDLMKVIIVEVTRAANTFGRAHLTEIRQAYEGIGELFRQAQEEGTFRTDVSPEFATLCFYGAVEQLLTAWIFEAIPATPDDFEHAKQMVIETVCGGLEVRVA
jgi:TetR/AcrR family transcriptional regulator, fatty acid metabolism regulator protein